LVTLSAGAYVIGTEALAVSSEVSLESAVTVLSMSKSPSELPEPSMPLSSMSCCATV
jgi:hypothetical protein